MRPTDPLRIATAALAIAAALPSCAGSGVEAADARYMADHYTKHEYEIPMRDGVKLFTAVYTPKDTSERYPFLVRRTPYSVQPYGAEGFPRWLGPGGSRRFAEEGYIFVYQDVRGRFMSEGVFRHMTPHLEVKQGPEDIDESTDMYDTVEWLLTNVRPNNGRVGIWGISYPGFYAAASIIDGHPAIRAASPQAPIGDWFVGDDFHHKGAFYLQDAFNFFSIFATNRTARTTEWGPRFDFGTDDAYQFFLDLGPLSNVNDLFFHHEKVYWDTLMTHGTYDTYWQARNIIPHMRNVKAAVMTVAGWYDAEDPYGPIEIYRSIEEQNPDIVNFLVVGPWFHGGWARSAGDRLGNVSFGSNTAGFYRDSVDLPFFNFYLKDKGTADFPEALVFASGSNEWHRLEAWPPEDSAATSFYLGPDQTLTLGAPTATSDTGYDAYTSDPAIPVPYTQETRIDRTREYMVEDQRFAADRPDVLVYETEPLTEGLTVAGPVTAELFFTTTGTDADVIVKLIDVYPDDAPPIDHPYLDVSMGGYQMLVRAEVLRTKFRNSYETPEPLVPGEITHLTFETPHVFHTFEPGHRIMVQVQSTWFPLVDRNPQTFLDIYQATATDFRPAAHRLYRSASYPSRVVVGRLER